METKKIWANLSVKDLEQTHEFYTKLGFKLNRKFSKENELVSILVGEDEVVVHFFLEESLKPAMGGEIAELSKANEVMFTLSAESREEVDQWAEAVNPDYS